MSGDEYLHGYGKPGMEICRTCGSDFYPDTLGGQMVCDFCLKSLPEQAADIERRVREAIEEMDRVLPLAQ